MAACAPTAFLWPIGLLAKHDENYVPKELADIDMSSAEHTKDTLGEMIAETGLAALWLAAAMALLQLVGGLTLLLRRGRGS